MSYFQIHYAYYYYHILHKPLGLLLGHRYTTHSITTVSTGTNILSMFPQRAHPRCYRELECNLAGLLSVVSSVTLCSHSIRAPLLRGAADKILIILALELKGPGLAEKGGVGGEAHTTNTQAYSRMQISQREIQ